jgi:hypothetical protein
MELGKQAFVAKSHAFSSETLMVTPSGETPSALNCSPWSHFWVFDPPILFLIQAQWNHIYAIHVQKRVLSLTSMSSLSVSGHKIVFSNPYSKDPCRITSWTSSEANFDTIPEILTWVYPLDDLNLSCMVPWSLKSWKIDQVLLFTPSDLVKVSTDEFCKCGSFQTPTDLSTCTYP